MTSEAVVDRTAFGRNIRHLQATVAPAELMVVLKADAYGHGLVPMAQAAVEAGARRLGVLEIASALAVRNAGIGPEVTVMAWQYPPGQDFTEAVRLHVDLGVSQESELQAAAKAAADAGGTPASVHLKIDTGLNRNGASERDWPQLVSLARRLQDSGAVRVAGVWSHIAETSEEEDTRSMARFAAAISVARELGVEFPLRHLAASSAGLRRSDVRFDMVRMGGHCWGIPSFDGVTPGDIGLVPVMTLRSRVSAVLEGPGERVARVPLGYADGIPYRAAGRVEVSVDGRRARVLRVFLDSMEVEGDAHTEPGMPVVLFGTGAQGEQTVREWGDLTDTLGDEIVTRIGKDVPRRYIGSGGEGGATDVQGRSAGSTTH